MAKDHSVNAGESHSATKSKVGTSQSHGPGRRRSAILIVGDDTEGLRRYMRSFSAYGYTVEIACDGTAADGLAREKEFDVVVSDVDGSEVPDCGSLRRIRERHARVPLVVLSKGLGFAAACAAVDCGAHRYLIKPVSDERLLEVVVEAMQDAASRER